MCHLKTRPVGGEHDLIDRSQPAPQRAGLIKNVRHRPTRRGTHAVQAVGCKLPIAQALRLRGVLAATGSTASAFLRDAVTEKLDREVA